VVVMVLDEDGEKKIQGPLDICAGRGTEAEVSVASKDIWQRVFMECHSSADASQ
jgi:hypothetical protein